ncbi:MAG: cyclase family protein [Christensenellales bacterium]
MKQYHDDSWMKDNRWGDWGKDDQKGAINDLSPELILKAVGMVKQGKIYDLETERFKGMPIWPGHCGFDILSYASPTGRQNMMNSNYGAAYNWGAPGGMLDPKTNKYNLWLNTEIIVAPLHSGTHIDALCHWTVGEDNHWYNGYTANKYCTNFGPIKTDISQIPPMVMRGVLLDIAGYKGVDHVPANYIITAEDCEACAKWEGVELKKGDAVLVRNGERWPENDNCPDAGLGISAARYLVEGNGALLVGDDMACIDGFNADGTSSVPNHPQPVHHYLLVQQGVHILEFVQLNELAKDKVYEFCFICTTAKIRSATGMFVRPIAII